MTTTTARTGAHPCSANINMLPIIDLSPMDVSCIYSTLSFLTAQAERLNVQMPCVTFDQPFMTDIFLYSYGKRKCNDGDKCMNIHKVQEKFGSDVCCQIVVLNVFDGCDTTSAIFEHGKGNVLS